MAGGGGAGWCVGIVERTEEKGDFPAEAVYVLPCLTKPPTDILVGSFSDPVPHTVDNVDPYPVYSVPVVYTTVCWKSKNKELP